MCNSMLLSTLDAKQESRVTSRRTEQVHAKARIHEELEAKQHHDVARSLRRKMDVHASDLSSDAMHSLQ